MYMSFGDLNDYLDLLERIKGTPWENVIHCALIVAVLYCCYKWILVPIFNVGRRLISFIQKRLFVSKHFHESLSFMNSQDVYYAINNYVPTRYSTRDPANHDEPTPEYIGEDLGREPLLLSHFLKYEFDQKNGSKYYLCLGDCGIGKTTFLINLYYETLRKKKHKCAFVSLLSSDCIDLIEKIDSHEKTVLLLDALDENESAAANFDAFIARLESATKLFYRVIITSRTNFFPTEDRERLSASKASASTACKILSAKKYYIAPFTDEDIQYYLKKRYRLKKYKQAWNFMEENKNLSVRPMLLRYLDDLLANGKSFTYNFQLYDYLFKCWIQREKGSVVEKLGKDLYNECILLAKAIYYQWRKTGRIGIYPNEIDESTPLSGLTEIKFGGHALLNRTGDGMFKFAHKSFWEFLLAKLSLCDVYFADDLLIHNFSQAEAFLREMVDSKEFDAPECSLAIAIYYLKYKKPERAEILANKVLQSNASERLRLFAQIMLIRSYQQQMKEASAESLILSLYEILRNTELTNDLVPLYAKYGKVLATYSRPRALSIGRDFLRGIIDYCGTDSHFLYILLECYADYCYCSMNVVDATNALAEMENILRLCQQDQYADYLYVYASNRHHRYDDLNTYPLVMKLNDFKRFLTRYDALIVNGLQAVSAIAVCFRHYYGSFDKYQEVALDSLEDNYNICRDIYADDDYGDDLDIRTPYFALLSEQLVRYFSFFDDDYLEDGAVRVAGKVAKLKKFEQSCCSKYELQWHFCYWLRADIDCHSGDFVYQRDICLEWLRFAREVHCVKEEISALWKLFTIFTDHHNRGAQQSLQYAYERARSDADYKMTHDYCFLLQVVLDFHDDPELKSQAYLELQNTVSGILGLRDDTRCLRIYRSLRDYACKKGFAQAIAFAKEVLQRSFTRYELVRLYDTCTRFSNVDCFITELVDILREQPEITQSQQAAIEEFIREDAVSFNLPSDFCQRIQDSVEQVTQQKRHDQISRRVGISIPTR